MYVESLAEHLYGIAASAFRRPVGDLKQCQPLMQAHALDNSPQRYKQMQVTDMTPPVVLVINSLPQFPGLVHSSEKTPFFVCGAYQTLALFWFALTKLALA